MYLKYLYVISAEFIEKLSTISSILTRKNHVIAKKHATKTQSHKDMTSYLSWCLGFLVVE